MGCHDCTHFRGKVGTGYECGAHFVQMMLLYKGERHLKADKLDFGCPFQNISMPREGLTTEELDEAYMRSQKRRTDAIEERKQKEEARQAELERAKSERSQYMQMARHGMTRVNRKRYFNDA